MSRKQFILKIFVVFFVLILVFGIGCNIVAPGALNKGYLIGIFTGGIVGLIIAIILYLSSTIGESGPAEYDERQLISRGIAYKYAFYTMLVYYMLLFVCSTCEIVIPVESSILYLIGAVLGLEVMVTYCIWHDSYWALNQKRRGFMLIFMFVGVANTVTGVKRFSRGTLFADGILTGEAAPLIMGITFLWIGVVFGVKALHERLEDRE